MSTDETTAETPRRRALYGVAVALLVSSVCFAHFFRLVEVPRGLYFDECSVGLNAALVAADGRDEHGVFLPVFFVTFGNLKNPIIIYTAALLFRLAGPSDWLLRATPALFFVISLAGLWTLVRRLFPGSRAVALYTLAAGGFLPWFFTLSRFAMEDSSQVPLLVWSLVLAHLAYEEEGRRPLIAALGLGSAAGISIYSYTTARLLSFLFVLALLAAYPRRRYWARHAAMLASFAVALVPYVSYAFAHPGELTRRFSHVSYLHDPALSPAAKLARFAAYYAASFTPSFLLVSGDPNRRHSTGMTGEIFVTVFVLALAGLVWWVSRALPRGDGDRFARFLLLTTVASPLGMALTEPQHAMRGVELGLCLLLASCYGFALLAGGGWKDRRAWTSRPPRSRRRLAALTFLGFALALECAHLVYTYFGAYAAVSEEAYLSYDFEGLVETALRGGAREIVVVPRPHVFYALPAFYLQTRKTDPPRVPLHTGPPLAAPGTCLVYFIEDLRIQGGDRWPSQLLGTGHQTLMRCFSLPPMSDPG